MKIIIFIESSNNTIHPVSLETIVAAQKLKSDTISIAAGMFSNPTTLKTYCNIFTKGKLDYYKLDNRIKRFSLYSE